MSSRQEKVLALAVSLWIASGGVAAAETTVTVESGETVEHVYNGEKTSTTPSEAQPSGEKTGYHIIINGGTVNGYVYGGCSYDSNALGNSVTINGGTLGRAIVGGYVVHASGKNACNNIVKISDGTLVVSGIIGGFVDVTGNTYAYGNGYGLGIYGGQAESAVDGQHRGNTVAISGSTFEDETSVYGAKTTSGPASYNKVSVTNTTFKGDGTYIYGGYHGNTGVDASHNEITVSDSTFAMGVKINGGKGANNTTNTATYNIVNLKNVKNILALYGGYGGNNDSDLLTGNTLNLSSENQATGTVGNFETVNIKEAVWGKPALDAATFQNVTKVDVSGLTFANPEVATGKTTLLTVNNGLTAVFDPVEKSFSYQYVPVAGVTVDGTLNGSASQSGNSIIYTATSNNATKLTFGNVAWKDSGALLDHSTTMSNVDFNGAAVDTSKIHFTNIQSLEADKKMTLVSSFGDTVGTITGTEYTVGTTLKGKGKASLSGNDLIYTVETAIGSNSGNGGKDDDGGDDKPVVQANPQTHNTLMGMEAGMGALTAGTESIGEAMTGLASSANTGSDGVAVYAGMGGGTSRQKTGSHVDSHNWNAILAIGTKNETSKGSVEWGGFFEYGRWNFTTHSDVGRADGSTSYTGGGLLAKWTTPQDIYVEGSFRAGRTHDTATYMLHDDVLGRSYGYNVHADYIGGHIGVGKIFRLDEGRNIDVYGKFFYNRRGGVSFNAGGQYNLDAVESKILRTGFKYNADMSKGWNWYAGLAYEYEFDGKSTGTADGAPIRAASIKGGSVLGEVGLHLSATETNPWEADLNLHGSCGQHRGVGGTVSVVYKF